MHKGRHGDQLEIRLDGFDALQPEAVDVHERNRPATGRVILKGKDRKQDPLRARFQWPYANLKVPKSRLYHLGSLLIGAVLRKPHREASRHPFHKLVQA